MCFGSPKPPAQSAPPVQTPPPTLTPPPTPTPTPSEVSPQASNEARRKRLELQRAGFAGTIKTSSRGITGSGPNLWSATLLGKDKLGA